MYTVLLLQLDEDEDMENGETLHIEACLQKCS